MTKTAADDLHPGLAPLGVSGVLRNIWGVVFGFFSTMVVFWIPAFIVALALVPFKQHRRFCDWWIGWWMDTLLAIYGIDLDVVGQHHIDPNKTYVIVANHRSWLDAVVMVACLRNVLPFSVIIKRGLTYIPLAGWFMLLAGYVPVDRGGKEKKKKGKTSKEKMDGAVGMLHDGRCILIFPEGTRAPSHKFIRFKRGASTLARDAQKELLPICISGTQRLFPKGTFIVRPGKVRMEIGAPIPPPDVDATDLKDVNQKIVDALVLPYQPVVDGPTVAEQPEFLQRIRPQ